MHYMINNRNYSQDELYNIIALRIYQQATDQTIGSIIAYARNGIGAQPISCHGLISTIQQSRVTSLRTIYAAVEQDRAHWGPEAMRIYNRWSDANSQLVQR